MSRPQWTCASKISAPSGTPPASSASYEATSSSARSKMPSTPTDDTEQAPRRRLDYDVDAAGARSGWT